MAVISHFETKRLHIFGGSSSSSSSSSSRATCPTSDTSGPAIVPLAGSLTFHQLAIIIGAVGTVFAVFISLLLILRHATHYSVPPEQKNVMRIVFIIPVFAVVSLLIIIFEDAAIYLTPIRDLYEAFAFVGLFQLICAFINPNDTELMSYLYTSGHAAIYKRAQFAIYQFPAVMIIVTVATEITEATGTYCQTSNKVHFAHIWLTIIRILSTAIAFISLLKFYGVNKPLLKARGTMPKLAAFKGIVFLNVVQTAIFSFLASSDDLTPTNHFSYNDLSQGLPALIICLEMLVFALIQSFVYRVAEYKIAGTQKVGGYYGAGRAFVQAVNFSDVFAGMVRAVGMLCGGRR